MLEIVQFEFYGDLVALVCYRHEKNSCVIYSSLTKPLTSAIKNSDQRSVSKTVEDAVGHGKRKIKLDKR